MSTKRYYTVVYEATDAESAEVLAKSVGFTKTLTDLAPIEGVRIVACGEGDYATERDAYFKEVVHCSSSPFDVLVSYIQDEHPDRISREQAIELASAVSPD